MITRLAVRNFQAIARADLDLGNFTVIVGPSSSGKSALLRAVRALASNVRGTNVITRGQKEMAITATLDHGVLVTLERGERTSSYRLAGDGDDHQFTKLAGEVPQLITDTLRLNPGTDSVNFAGQFDKPYLLDESGAVIARQLAELTNVNQIFEAVRTANRIRISAQNTAKLRATDLEAVTTGLKAFQGLSRQLDSLAHIQTLDERRRAAQSRLDRLDMAVRTLTTAEYALAGYRPLEIPDDRRLADLVTRFKALRDSTMKVVDRSTEAKNAAKQGKGAVRAVTAAQEKLDELLRTVGVCPTCKQPL